MPFCSSGVKHRMSMALSKRLKSSPSSFPSMVQFPPCMHGHTRAPLGKRHFTLFRSNLRATYQWFESLGAVMGRIHFRVYQSTVTSLAIAVTSAKGLTCQHTFSQGEQWHAISQLGAKLLFKKCCCNYHKHTANWVGNSPRWTLPHKEIQQRKSAWK